MDGLKEKNEGNKAFQNGDYNASVSWYSKAIELCPNEHTYYSNRSAAYSKLGKFTLALNDAQTSCKLKPDWYKAHFRIGEAYAGMRLYAKAREAYANAQAYCNNSDPAIEQAIDVIDQILESRVTEDDERTTRFPAEIEQRLQTLRAELKKEGNASILGGSMNSSMRNEVTNTSELKSKREEFMRSIGISSPASTTSASSVSSAPSPALTGDWAKIRGSDVQVNANEGPRLRRAEMEDATLSDRSAFIRSMGLDMRNPEERDVSSLYSTPQSGSQRVSDVESLQSSPASRSAAEATPPPPPFSYSSVPDALDEFQMLKTNTMPSAEVLIASVANKPLPKFDYKAAGAQIGAGQDYRQKMLEQFRQRKEVDVSLREGVGDERLNEIKKTYNDFSYRQYREKGGSDTVTKSRVMDGAILAEAMSGYDYKKQTR